MRNHFLHALILFCGNTATEMTNPLASIGAMGYHFGNTVNKEALRIVGVRSTEQSAGIKVGGFCPDIMSSDYEETQDTNQDRRHLK